MVAKTNHDRLGRLYELFGQAIELIRKGKRSPGQIENLLHELQRFKENIPLDVSRLLIEWQDFYHQVYGIEADFSSLRIPERQKGFDRLIIVVPGMTPQRLYDKCKEMFPCWKWTKADLDKIVTSDRTAKNGAYAVWFRDRVEADKELKNLSANTLKDLGVVGITLEERLLYEQKFFLETGKHLDIDNGTLCSGSRHDDGGVLSVESGNLDRLDISWFDSGVCHAILRARAAVL
ncbi:MAG: hypothetical protein PHC97_01210 [Patescibacteria group bacterium]|nr:hypothetical protein [Patescibacteria group bacterium]